MQSGNLYIYALYDPVDYLDPSGNIALVDDLVVTGLVFLAATAVYAATPLLTKMLQEMGKTFTDLCNMTAKEIRWLIELAKSKYAESQAASQCATAVAAPAAPDPDDDKNGKYQAPKGGGGITDSIKTGDTQIDFGHGGRHLEGSNLSIQEVQQAIAKDIVNRPLEIGKYYSGMVNVNGITIRYSAFLREAGLINIGMFYILK